MQMGTAQVSFVRSPCSLPCPSLSLVSVQWSSNKVHFYFVRPGPTSAVRLITSTGRYFLQPGGNEHRFLLPEGSRDEPHAAHWVGAAYCVPTSPQHHTQYCT